jgi:hypothetical protein
MGRGSGLLSAPFVVTGVKSMNKIYTLPEDELKGEIYQRILRLMGKNWGTWESVLAVAGLFGGLLSIILGVLVWAAVGLFTPAGALGRFLDVAGTVLFVLPLPLLALGAYCLDLLEKKPPALPLPAESQPDLPRRVVRPLRAVRRGRHTLNLIMAVWVAALSLVLPATVRAQQTIFNVPTTDVLDRGKVYAELDVPFNPNTGGSVGRFSSFVPRVIIGVGGRTEVRLNVTGNVQPGADTTTLVPTAKHKLYDGGDNGWAVIVGHNLFLPIRNRQYDAGGYSYAAVSKTAGRTRLTAGGYHYTSDVVAPGAQRAGGQFGFEQTVNPRLTLAADWITGRHSNGYFTPGAIFKPHTQVTGYAGFSVGNGGAAGGNHFFLLEVGFNFN